MKDLAILHDPWMSKGGSERVANQFARLLDAPIIIPWGDTCHMEKDINYINAFPTWAGKIGTRNYLIKDVLEMLLWPNVHILDEYKTILVTKNGASWYVPRDYQNVIAYVHSTPRNLFDNYNRNSGVIKSGILTVMRALHKSTVLNYDKIAVNSDVVKRRVELYWDKKVDSVIYPTGGVQTVDRPHFGEGYITISRLEPNKRILQVVKMVNGTNIPLKIFGEGSQYRKLIKLASSNVEIMGYIPEGEKMNSLAKSKAFVFNARSEDFGIAPVESLAAGTPVIGVDEGFTSTQVINGKNGYLYQRGELVDAIKKFERFGVDWSPQKIQSDAISRFQLDSFNDKITSFVYD
jgi:glycosyltransferase involved in cell wall biosynthesis